jgi:hypothetical protein
VRCCLQALLWDPQGKKVSLGYLHALIFFLEFLQIYYNLFEAVFEQEEKESVKLRLLDKQFPFLSKRDLSVFNY